MKSSLRLFIALLAFACIGAQTVNPAPEYYLVLPMTMLQQRMAIESMYASMFFFGGDSGNFARFEGRREVYAELIALLNGGIPQSPVVSQQRSIPVPQVTDMLEQLAFQLDGQAYASGMYGQLFPDTKEQNKGRMDAYRSAASQVRERISAISGGTLSYGGQFHPADGNIAVDQHVASRSR